MVCPEQCFFLRICICQKLTYDVYVWIQKNPYVSKVWSIHVKSLVHMCQKVWVIIYAGKFDQMIHNCRQILDPKIEEILKLFILISARYSPKFSACGGPNPASLKIIYYDLVCMLPWLMKHTILEVWIALRMKGNEARAWQRVLKFSRGA